MKRQYPWICVAATLLVVMAGAYRSTFAACAEPEWRVGLARVCISPDEPVWLYGYAGKDRFKPFEAVLDDVFATALAIQSGNAEPAVLITADLCVLRKPEAEALCVAIMEKTGLARRQILLNWSHTHSGPMLGSSDMNRYPIESADLEATKAYTEQLWRKLAGLAADALAALEPARLSWGVGEIGFVTNRRRPDSEGNYQGMGPNPDGLADRSVPVLRVDSPDGRLRALVFGTACHPVTLGGGSNKLSADFPGYARRYIEKELPGATTLFVQGCGADANPQPRATADQEEVVCKQGDQLGAEVCRVASGELQPIRGPLRVAFAMVDLPLEPAPAGAELGQRVKGPFWQSHNAKRIIEAQSRGESIPAHYSAPLAMWRFGDDLTLVAISGEVVSDYAFLSAEALGAERVWVAGYCNEVFGYLPSARIVREGGYETLGLVSVYVGQFSAEAEQVLLAAVRAMRQAVR
ncbi:MAG: hypothetical protein U1E05_08150 [Patescibacteria group bacterium]|nr:hypothetical protein [Patescibacteria group bacterium]